MTSRESLTENPWRYVFYASMFVLTVWLILKVFGVINTPIWLEFGVPIGSFIIGLIALFQSLIRDMQGIVKDMHGINISLAVLSTKFDGMALKVSNIEHDLAAVRRDVTRHDIKLGAT